MDALLDIDWATTVAHLVQVGIAFLLALPLGWEREAARDAPGAGLRTFPLVAAGCCSYLLIGRSVFEGDEAHARILYGLMTGIGFIGGGSILKTQDRVSGTATAAGIWNTGAIGAAVAWGRFEIALVLAVISLLALQLGPLLKPMAREKGGKSGR
jgi:putative Mg2+ transporter-C (MgtC) family protein